MNEGNNLSLATLEGLLVNLVVLFTFIIEGLRLIAVDASIMRRKYPFNHAIKENYMRIASGYSLTP